MTVNIKGTFSAKQREHNGLEAVQGPINADRLIRIPVVGYVVWHAHRETATDDVVTVNLEAVEPACNDDGTENATSTQVWTLLDRLRKQRGKGNVADTLFSTAGGEEPQLPGQTAIDLGRPVRDGREVPPADGAEIMAERDERNGTAADKPEPSTPGGSKAKPAKSTAAPVTFSPGGDGAA